MLRAAGFQVTEAVWWPNGTLVVHFCSTMEVSDWALAELPRCMRIAGEEVDAQFKEHWEFKNGRDTAIAVYKTAVRPSKELLLKEYEPSAHADVIAFEVS